MPFSTYLRLAPVPHRPDLLKNKIRNIVSGAAAVLAGSPYLVEYARAINSNVEWAPTCVDIARFPTKKWDDGWSRPLTIGWIGAPSSIHFATGAIPAIRGLARRIPIRLVYVGFRACQIRRHHAEISHRPRQRKLRDAQVRRWGRPCRTSHGLAASVLSNSFSTWLAGCLS